MNIEKDYDRFVKDTYFEDLLIEFDEMGFEPTTIVPNFEEYAKDFKRKLIKAFIQLNKENIQKFYDSFIDDIMRGCGDDEEFWVVKLINKRLEEFDLLQR